MSDDTLVMVTTRVPKTLAARIRALAAQSGQTLRTVITSACEEALRQGQKPKRRAPHLRVVK